jgi:hypothetical protein
MSAAPSGQLAAAEAIKACCAGAYESEAARFLLGGELHPGGQRLTARTAQIAGLRAGQFVLDVASGAGTSAMLLAERIGCRVIGIDYSEAGVAAAEAQRGALTPLVRYVHGDAESLPFDRGTFDAVLCECSLCTFPNKARAMAEMRRVLRVRGTVMISDVVAAVPELPPPLRSAAAQVACVADALDSDGYAALLHEGGFDLVAHERHDRELVRMIDGVQARVRVARMTGLGRMEELSGAFDTALELLDLARESALCGRLGYGVFVARARS